MGAHGSGPMGKFGYQLMTVEDAEWIARRMIEYGIRWYEYGDQSSDDNINCWLDPPKAMKRIFDSIPPEPPPPPVIVERSICFKTRKLSRADCRDKIIKAFILGEEPTEKCDRSCQPCKYWLRRLNFRRWIKCLLGG